MTQFLEKGVTSNYLAVAHTTYQLQMLSDITQLSQTNGTGTNGRPCRYTFCSHRDVGFSHFRGKMGLKIGHVANIIQMLSDIASNK